MFQQQQYYYKHSNSGQHITRCFHLLSILCQTLGLATFVGLPNKAVSQGTLGYIIGYILTYVIVGLPLLYMEFIVSQFTARNCIQVWKIRNCFSHIGYFYLLWQVVVIVYNHVIASFTIHYFLISFENPIPYFKCGRWSTRDCDILRYNYTINQDCLKLNMHYLNYCGSLIESYPEFQYWRFFLLGERYKYYYVAWQVVLASGIACIILYFSCFKRSKSLRWFMMVFAVYPITGNAILMIGSMMQKGLVLMYEDSLDVNFVNFMQHFRFADIVIQVAYSLNIGTGISFNISGFSPFRSPCYSNIVVTVAVSATLAIFAICTIAMMPCPYAYEFSTKPTSLMTLPLSLLFERIPKMLSEYTNPRFWLVLSYSCNAILGISTNIIILFSLLEMLADRFAIVKTYPGFVSFLGIIIMFLTTAPLFGNTGVLTVFNFSKSFHPIVIFLAIIECIVFVLCYGVDKFCEDVHFMEGVQPNSLMKFGWFVSTGILIYVFFSEIVHNSYNEDNSFGEILGWWLVIVSIIFIVGITIIKLVYAALKKKFDECVRLNPKWGPRSDLLLRSRAMFTAQAMTKEYIYRQYHLQAGIVARQRTSNVRREVTNPLKM